MSEQPNTVNKTLKDDHPLDDVQTDVRQTILVVEDEPAVRVMVADFLIKGGYNVLTAEDGLAALRVCDNHQGPIHLLLTDIVMPEMGGIELAGRIAVMRTDTKILFMSGYVDVSTYEQSLCIEGYRGLVQKPFSPDALLEKLNEIL